MLIADFLSLATGWGFEGDLLHRLPARHLVARLQFQERGLLGALVEGERAPGPEPAARRGVEQRRRPARDPDQGSVGVAHADLGQRANNICV